MASAGSRGEAILCGFVQRRVPSSSSAPIQLPPGCERLVGDKSRPLLVWGAADYAFHWGPASPGLPAMLCTSCRPSQSAGDKRQCVRLIHLRGKLQSVFCQRHHFRKVVVQRALLEGFVPALPPLMPGSPGPVLGPWRADARLSLWVPTPGPRGWGHRGSRQPWGRARFAQDKSVHRPCTARALCLEQICS